MSHETRERCWNAAVSGFFLKGIELEKRLRTDADSDALQYKEWSVRQAILVNELLEIRPAIDAVLSFDKGVAKRQLKPLRKGMSIPANPHSFDAEDQLVGWENDAMERFTRILTDKDNCRPFTLPVSHPLETNEAVTKVSPDLWTTIRGKCKRQREMYEETAQQKVRRSRMSPEEADEKARPFIARNIRTKGEVPSKRAIEKEVGCSYHLVAKLPSYQAALRLNGKRPRRPRPKAKKLSDSVLATYGSDPKVLERLAADETLSRLATQQTNEANAEERRGRVRSRV